MTYSHDGHLCLVYLVSYSDSWAHGLELCEQCDATIRGWVEMPALRI
jgi:hypothetical protein